jgi:TatD DNase family protein
MIDTHCHLEKQSYDSLDSVVQHMQGNYMITAACDLNSAKEVLEVIHDYENVYGVIGIHPEELDSFCDKDLLFIEEHINDPKVVGIGEIGLDYYYTKANALQQKELFIKQLELAKKYNKCVVVHSRDALEDTLLILKNYPTLKIILHCYGYSYEASKEFLKLNVKLGIGGVVTFKNGKKLKEVVFNTSLDKLLLETDSPYLAPEPFRGHKNEPYNIVYVAEEIAKIKGITKEEVLLQTTLNAKEQFDLPF